MSSQCRLTTPTIQTHLIYLTDLSKTKLKLKLIPYIYTHGMGALFLDPVHEMPVPLENCLFLLRWYFSTLYQPNISNTKPEHNKTLNIITYSTVPIL